ncbi:hypothetical protein CVS40_6960 [Lucilia cuprina]|nr:hypothetical protein CVS40_6960 [Lucilia cuprina]
MEVLPESNINEVKKTKPPPIGVEADKPFTEIQKLLGKDCMYKRTPLVLRFFLLVLKYTNVVSKY